MKSNFKNTSLSSRRIAITAIEIYKYKDTWQQDRKNSKDQPKVAASIE